MPILRRIWANCFGEYTALWANTAPKVPRLPRRWKLGRLTLSATGGSKGTVGTTDMFAQNEIVGGSGTAWMRRRDVIYSYPPATKCAQHDVLGSKEREYGADGRNSGLSSFHLEVQPVRAQE